MTNAAHIPDDDRPTVLAIVEDEPDVRILVRVTLQRDQRLNILGEAASAEEALHLARTLQPGVVILDHSLEGDVTGLDVAPKIRQASPDSKIVLFTAYDMEREAAAEPAIDAFLRKDRISELLSVVDRLLGLDPLAS